MDDEEKPRPQPFMLNADLDDMSVTEIDERVDLLEKEIARLKEERKRKQGFREKLGFIGECVSQRVAYCIHLTQALVLLHQEVCARTPDHCNGHYEENRTEPKEIFNVVSPCQPMLNTGYFDGNAGFSERRLRE